MLNLNPYLKKINNHSPILFNLGLWLSAFIILLFIFSRGQRPITVDYVYTVGFLISLALPSVINLYTFMPRLLKKEKYILYCLAFIINLLIFSQLHIVFFKPILNNLFPNYFFISYHSNTNPIITFSIFLVATTLIKLSEDWFHFNRNENRELRIKNQQIETQLSNLRAQINPHFLFNSLNVIYALAIEKKEGITDAIVQLSDILRYIIYDADTKRISIKEEIKLLDNYIKFQKFRVHGFNNITFNSSIENESLTLYPMLLLPLLENSFKHGLKGNLKDTFILINIFQKNHIFKFSIENNMLLDASNEKLQYSGVGLEHIKNNLNLVYPEQHEFKITKTETTFKVDITITLNTLQE